MSIGYGKINTADTREGSAYYSYDCYSVKLDPYVVDTLMRDLAAHGRSRAAFLVYLNSIVTPTGRVANL